MSLESRWNQQLHALKAQGRLRQLRVPHGLDFSSNDYLGYGQLALGEASTLSRSGCASRLLRGHHPLWEEVETQLARWHQAEAALVFNSGYVANEGLLSTILEDGDWVASDQFNHASIIDGLRLTRAERFIFRHNDLPHLEEGLRQAGDRQKFIVTESLFGMEGDLAPLAEMVSLAEKYQARVIVDEAHATGCFGPAGSGLVDALGLRKRVLATVHTGGKALGVTGAYVVGSWLLRDILVNRCRHQIFTTALPPQVAQWWLEMLPRVQADEASRRRLHDNASFFRDLLRGMELRGGHFIVPLVLGDDTRAVTAAERLQSAGFDIRAIRPPTVPAGTSRLRISIHADHKPSDLEHLAELLK